MVFEGPANELFPVPVNTEIVFWYQGEDKWVSLTTCQRFDDQTIEKCEQDIKKHTHNVLGQNQEQNDPRCLEWRSSASAWRSRQGFAPSAVSWAFSGWSISSSPSSEVEAHINIFCWKYPRFWNISRDLEFFPTKVETGCGFSVSASSTSSPTVQFSPGWWRTRR